MRKDLKIGEMLARSQLSFGDSITSFTKKKSSVADI
jgi:hypothetical protein